MNQQKEGYIINAIQEDNHYIACIGYRRITTLAWGKIVYIDDLTTCERCRGKEYGKHLLEHVMIQAKT